MSFYSLRVRLISVHAVILLFGVALLIGALPVHGQDRTGAADPGAGDGAFVTLTGSVRAGDTGEPLQGATIALLHGSDSVLVTGGVTDGSGAFRVRRVPAGSYHLRVSFVGFSSAERSGLTLMPGAPEMDLGVFRLDPVTAVTEGVEVTAEREMIEVQIDRTVFNVRDQITAIGGSASDVLQELPSIEVDLDGNVSYRGNDNVAIHINGRPSSLEGDALVSFLKSLSAESIERVEVLPNPSARYEPDGKAGIINIVLVENRSAGWSGGLSAGVGTNTSYSGSGNLGYQRGPWQFYSSYGYRHDDRESSATRFRENLLKSPSILLDQRSTEDETRHSHTWTTQAEYKVAPKSTISFQGVMGSRNQMQYERTNYVERITGVPDDQYARLVDETGADLSLDSRFGFDHQFGSDAHTLTAEVRYEREWEDESGVYNRHVLFRDLLGEPLQSDNESIEETEQEGTLQIDYKRPLGNLTLEAGYQGSIRSEATDQQFEPGLLAGTDAGPTINAYSFDEQIHASYGILGAEKGPIGVQAGVRAEQAITTFSLDELGGDYDNNYFSLFPSTFVRYKFSDGDQLRLSYSKRVNRPRLWQLNPVTDNEDPTFRRVGNPFLDPEYVHAFEATYVRVWGALTLTGGPYFHRTVNEVQWQETFTPDGVTTLSFANADASNSYGLEFISALTLGSRFRGNVSLNGYRIVTDASNLDTDLSNEAFAYSGRATFSAQLRAGLDLQLSQYYRSPMDIAGGRIASRSMTTMGAKQELFGGRASLGVQARDLLGTMRFHITRRDDSFFHETEREWDARQVSVSFMYHFGQANQNRRARDRGDDGGDMGGMEMQ